MSLCINSEMKRLFAKPVLHEGLPKNSKADVSPTKDPARVHNQDKDRVLRSK